jgi:hypothetical protein
MEKRIERVLSFLTSVVAAALTAFILGHIAQDDFGLSRQEIRTPAMVGAAVIALLVAVEVFGKKLRKLK